MEFAHHRKRVSHSREQSAEHHSSGGSKSDQQKAHHQPEDSVDNPQNAQNSSMSIYRAGRKLFRRHERSRLAILKFSIFSSRTQQSLCLDDLISYRVAHQVAHRMNFQFAHNISAMRFSRLSANSERSRHLFAAPAFGKQLHNFALARSKPLTFQRLRTRGRIPAPH